MEMRPLDFAGTLMRVIPLDVQWEGHTAKFRVETGDTGKVLGTLQYEPTNGWMAYTSFDHPYQATKVFGSPFSDPMAALASLFDDYVQWRRKQPE